MIIRLKLSIPHEKRVVEPFVLRQFQRSLASSSSSSSSGPTIVTGPTEKLKSWQSGARLVKNVQVENQYMEHIREVHDPSQHLKTIEDELKGTIGKALGKQGQKVVSFLRAMEQERQRYQESLENHGPSSKAVYEAAKAYNSYRKQCEKARWELIVHRQAVGFIVGNHKHVMEKYPIPEALPEDGLVKADDESIAEPKEQKKKFGDQLDWWQKIGRWR